MNNPVAIQPHFFKMENFGLALLRPDLVRMLSKALQHRSTTWLIVIILAQISTKRQPVFFTSSSKAIIQPARRPIEQLSKPQSSTAQEDLLRNQDMFFKRRPHTCNLDSQTTCPFQPPPCTPRTCPPRPTLFAGIE
jgi:hypothetical protein